MMAAAAQRRKDDAWRRRLYVPNYQVGEAARYADISRQTVVAWQKGEGSGALSPRDKGASLSYLQLIEVAVVAAFRKAGVPLKEIKASREYLSKQLESEYPFTEYNFKTDGRSLFMDYEQVVGAKGKGVLLRPGKAGQMAWEQIIGGRLRQFEYERKGIVVRWYLKGRDSPILIDPRVAFGAPVIHGTPTWVVKGRWEAGEVVSEIADDFGLKVKDVQDALRFEGVDPSSEGDRSWTQ